MFQYSTDNNCAVSGKELYTYYIRARGFTYMSRRRMQSDAHMCRIAAN